MAPRQMLAIALMVAFVADCAHGQQGLSADELKAAVHQAALKKQGRQGDDPSTDKQSCCTVAMFLGTMKVPASGETLALGDAALGCCREQLCPKFTSESDCTWISSGDLTWKQKLSDDLDKVQTIDQRLDQLKSAQRDLDDPAAVNEERILSDERERIENSELQRLAKVLAKDGSPSNPRGPVAPLTAMCDQVLDSDQPVADIAEEQEARIQCISSFVDIAYGACSWHPEHSQCEAIVAPLQKGASTFGGTFTIAVVIACILGVTYYVARPGASDGDMSSQRSDYATLDQLPADLGGKGGSIGGAMGL